MTRFAIGVDRAVTLVVGLSLIALPIAAWQWHIGKLHGGKALRLPEVEHVMHAGWWPFATGAGGLILVLVGLRWLAAHRPARRATRVALDYDDDRSVTVNANAVARASATALKSKAEVLKASGSAAVRGGIPTVTLTATVPARHGLHAGVRAADATMRTAGAMLGDTVAIRTVLRTDANHRQRRVS